MGEEGRDALRDRPPGHPAPPQDPAGLLIAPDRLIVGKVRGAHGVRGELKVELYNPASAALIRGARIWVGEAPMRVVAVRATAQALLVTLAGIDDRDAAQALVGREISIERTALPAGEHYLADLIGFTVRTVSGDVAGILDGEAKGLAKTTLIVRRDGRDWLVPVSFLVGVDVAAREVLIDPPEGLLE